MPWYIFSGLYLIIWSALLVHCLLRRRFYPIFGQRWGTRVFWLLTFVFLNPLLTFLYFVFGFLLGPGKSREPRKPIGLGSVAAIAFVGVVLALFEWPFTGYDAGPPVVLRKESPERPKSQEHLLQRSKESLRRLEAHIGTIRARSGVQTFGSTSAESDARASVRSVMLVCQSPHHLLDRAARAFQKALVRLPDVDNVEYYPYETWPEPGGPLPDVFITMDILEIHEKTLLCSRRLNAIIQWKIGSTPLAGPARQAHAQVPPVVAFNLESRLDYGSTSVAIESPRAEYKLEADGISAEMIKSISKQFENLLDKHGRLPQVPQILCGTYREPPAFAFLSDHSAQRLISGSGLFKNNHTVWRFAQKRATSEALTACGDELKTLGWGSEDLGNDSLSMQKADEHIHIFRERRRDASAETVDTAAPDKPSSNVSMFACYESDFTPDQMQQAMDALLESKAEIETLLAFERYLRTPEQSERLRAILEASPVCTLDGSLVLGRYWAQRGDTDKGRQWLMRARAMQRAEKGRDARSQEIRSLAVKLGDESLAEVTVSEQTLRDVGFVNTERLTEPLKVERALGEPVLLYRRLDGGRLHTFALRVVRSFEVPLLAPYGLLVVEKREGPSSSSQTAGRVRPDGVWAAEASVQGLAGQNESTQLTVESVGDERFLFLITP